MYDPFKNLSSFRKILRETIEVTVVEKGDGETEIPVPPARTADNSRGEMISTGGLHQAKVFDEVDRISRMRCQDFLWEYDLMKEIAGAKPVYDERMLKTSLGMFIVHKSVKDDELNRITMDFSQGVREAVNECRKRPGAKYFLEVLSPILESRLER